MVDLLGEFSDINTKENVSQLPQSEYYKYMDYGLEAVKETMSRHR